MAISRMADLVGHVLGGRYRLMAPIGTGASARVLMADDVKLRRRVAVKLLHPGLAEDEAFLRRFRAEAQAAAALTHPNIMRVYDWGEDEDGPYLVMEHLGGGSLRDLLDAGHRLSPSQATALGIDTALALDFAHRRGFVHRDIKPANLLFDDEGRVSIADFGLARALAEAAWTEPSGAVLGTARYASPEQAKGLAADGKADVYALALVLVEAVTGQVPFAADTTIATLMARVDSPLVAPEELGPLAAAVEAAGVADPTARADGATFAKALHAAARELPPPAPLPTVDPVRTVRDDGPGPDPTELGHVRTTASPSATRTSEDDPTVLDMPRPGAGATAVTPAVYDHEEDVVVPDEVIPASGERPRRRWTKVLVAAVVILLLSAAGIAGSSALREARVPKYPVPELVGLDLAAAEKRVEGIDVELDVTRERRDGTTKGEVLSQSPAKGEVRQGGEIDVVVSDGQTLVGIPDLAAKPQPDAEAAITAAGLVVGTVDATTTHHETVPKGTVLDWSPKGAEVEKGTAVNLVLSAGPAPKPIPDLAGEPVEEAIKVLKDLGFVAKPTLVFSDDVEKGYVVSTTPGPGRPQAHGSEVKVTVSNGPDVVNIPDVRGLSVAEATKRIESAGLTVDGVNGNPNRTVSGTSPGAGKSIKRGSGVTIITSRGDD